MKLKETPLKLQRSNIEKSRIKMLESNRTVNLFINEIKWLEARNMLNAENLIDYCNRFKSINDICLEKNLDKMHLINQQIKEQDYNGGYDESPRC